MATFEICEGAPGQGKSLYTAQRTLKILKRNLKWYEKTGIRRVVWSNIKFSEAFEKAWGYGTPDTWIEYWTDSAKLCKLNDVDIIWDEIATELDARNFANLTTELKRFLSQYRKRGIDIYANTQDFSMIDARARLMINGVMSLTKILGSGDISTTKPAPKYIWGLIMIRTVRNYREIDPEKKIYEFIPRFMFIERSLVEIYDTRQDIAVGVPAPLKHTELFCEYFETPGHPCFHNKYAHQIKHA